MHAPEPAPPGVRAAPSSAAPIALVVSDVDGTLVTSDKRLSPATRAAVRALDAAGIGFTLASARPPFGLADLAAELGLRLPLGCYNGGTLVGPDLAVLEETLIPPETAQAAAAWLVGAGLDVWVFADDRWHCRDPHAAYVDLETRTLGRAPQVRTDLAPLLARAAKLVGVGGDPDRLARAEADLGAHLSDRATVGRSQAYYLDVTPAGVGKGTFVRDLARRLGIAPARIATIGDGANDVAMFEAGGLAIAMGNAEPAVRAAADAVSTDNDADGFARAIAGYVLARHTPA